MGCDIHLLVQVKRNGVWVGGDTPERLEDRTYPRFAFLTGGVVRNYENVPALLPGPRGLPTEFDPDDFGDHSRSWLLLSELLAVDYNTKLNPHNELLYYRYEDREIALGELLGKNWDDILEDLKAQGHPEDVRIVFGFDS